ncbi:hypothetical protein [Aquibium oceanicum]|uniref:Uncharacterized protein n=1 Tax=Aquibium oceanicum TaxID=1670800 RepID=A0A1L3SP99_9HYPH|nr:hypothetical protein [Aquibium oceanicum]APH71132.1 hypothetical protein BSQ44_06930 [Aquibium oceanicum]
MIRATHKTAGSGFVIAGGHTKVAFLSDTAGSDVKLYAKSSITFDTSVPQLDAQPAVLERATTLLRTAGEIS